MSLEHQEIRSGIVLFNGRISRNLMLEPMVSHVYFIEDGDEVIIFDPSCGKDVAKRIEAHIRSRVEAKSEWKKAILIAGHSHMDHANNFHLIDLIKAEDTHVFVHENGFQDGRVMNGPATFIQRMIEESKEYYNPYLVFPVPYNLLTYPFAALNTLFPSLAGKLFAAVSAIPWPRPTRAFVQTEPLRQGNMEVIELGYIKVKGWRLGDKIILHTPGTAFALYRCSGQTREHYS
jgi:hypothetical protein